MEMPRISSQDGRQVIADRASYSLAPMLVFLFTTTIGPFLCLFYHNIAEEDDVLSSIVIIMGETILFGRKDG